MIEGTYGRWAVLSFDRYDKSIQQNRWNCLCLCGTKRSVRADALRSGKSQLCGCLGKLKRAIGTRKALITHGHSSGGMSPTYISWSRMRDRCSKNSHSSYHNYGGRGITFCERWIKFENFLADMGPKPKGMVLDRIDNNGNYEPGNCRWTDYSTSNKNRRRRRSFA